MMASTYRIALLIGLTLLPTALQAQPASAGGAPLPLSLTEALRLAVGTSEQVAIARAGEQRARGQQAQARSALLPQVGSTLNWQKQLQNQFAAVAKRAGSGGTGSDTTSGNNATSSLTRIFASEYNFNLGLTASQPLYTGGRATANIRAARAGRDAAEIGITSAQAQAQLDVTQAYYDALLADRLLTIADSTLVQAERTLRQVQLTRSVGSASEFELIRARVTRDNQRPGWLQARTTRDLAYVHLRQLLNLEGDRAVTLTDSIVETPVTPSAANDTPVTTVNVAASTVLAIDPAVQARVSRTLASSDTVSSMRAPVRQALKGVEVAEQQLRATRAQRLPSIAASTNYQRLAYPTNVLPKSLADFFPNWTVGIGLSYPIFTGDACAARSSPRRPPWWKRSSVSARHRKARYSMHDRPPPDSSKRKRHGKPASAPPSKHSVRTRLLKCAFVKASQPSWNSPKHACNCSRPWPTAPAPHVISRSPASGSNCCATFRCRPASPRQPAPIHDDHNAPHSADRCLGEPPGSRPRPCRMRQGEAGGHDHRRHHANHRTGEHRGGHH
jgi:outer membrane protein TolC